MIIIIVVVIIIINIRINFDVLVKNIDLVTLSDAVGRICEPRWPTQPTFIIIVVIVIVSIACVTLDKCLHTPFYVYLLRLAHVTPSGVTSQIVTCSVTHITGAHM